MLVKGVPVHEALLVLTCFDDEEAYLVLDAVMSQMGIELSDPNEAFLTPPITTYSGDIDI